mgnify:CR=1 FL=1
MGAELEAIRTTKKAVEKGKRLERLIRRIFGQVPGLNLEDQDVVRAYKTQQMDLYFFNHREKEELHFLDCPLIIECKGWTKAIDGRELRYFADLLKDRGRRDGIFVALNGITGDADDISAVYHVATALAGGQLVLVISGNDLKEAHDPSSLVGLLQRRMLDQVKGQVLAIERSAQSTNRKIRSKKRSEKPVKRQRS